MKFLFKKKMVCLRWRVWGLAYSVCFLYDSPHPGMLGLKSQLIVNNGHWECAL